MSKPPDWKFDAVWTAAMRKYPDAETSSGWIRGHLAVVETPSKPMEYRGLIVPHRHVSVAVVGHGRRPNSAEMAMVRADFGMEDAEEDNHTPGVARHLFRPLHLPSGEPSECECKEDEEQVVEPDGFVWSRKKVRP